MRTINHPHTDRAVQPIGSGSRPARPEATRRPSVELIADGVVASYIHEISDRHHDAGSAERWTGGGS